VRGARADGSARPPWALEPAAGQESVWDYPRPPVCVPSPRLVTVHAGARLVASSTRAVRVLETSHPPTWYVPGADVAPDTLRPSTARPTFCEYKGVAEYLDVVDDEGRVHRAAAWRYPSPSPGYEAIAGHVAFVPRGLTCRVDGREVSPQPGAYYAGWITPDVVGPFKGGPGTSGW
jgi:uncharacterized protein (DUF427 family)